MTTQSHDDDIDLTRIIAKPLYFGLVSNILVPMGLLMVCYMLEQRGYNNDFLGQGADQLFYLLAVLSVGQAVFALWFRHKLSQKPMIGRVEKFEQDFAQSLIEQCRPVFLLIAGISLFGIIYFFLTARFNEAVFFVVFSFVIFQVARPRFGYVEKLIKKQRALTDAGKFRQEIMGSER